jgi:hypothetical protein
MRDTKILENYSKKVKESERRIGANGTSSAKGRSPKDDLDIFCSQDCKEEALAELDYDSDECLSCQ